MSKTFVGGVVCREFESEVPAAEEMLDHVVCSREQFSFQIRCALKMAMVAELFANGDREWLCHSAAV